MSKKNTSAKIPFEQKQLILNKTFTVLDEYLLKFSELVNAYKGENRYANELASQFLLRNSEALRFLEIEIVDIGAATDNYPIF